MNIDTLFQKIRNGERRALAKAITLIEGTTPQQKSDAVSLLDKITPYTGSSRRIGISGIPGVGKSTFINSFGLRQLQKGLKVAVLAIDPSSTTGKGSILGDKTRMGELAAQENAFIRPSPAGDSLGGVTHQTRKTIQLCEAAGFDFIIVETLGVGQAEGLVHSMVDMFLLLQIPRMGDDLQGIKRGILELVDIVAVNKSEDENRKAATQSKIELQGALSMVRGDAEWQPPIVLISSLNQMGFAELEERIATYWEKNQNEISRRRKEQLALWFDHELRTGILEAIFQDPKYTTMIKEFRNATLEKTINPTQAAFQTIANIVKRLG